jgi:hypothetical protein
MDERFVSKQDQVAAFQIVSNTYNKSIIQEVYYNIWLGLALKLAFYPVTKANFG